MKNINLIKRVSILLSLCIVLQNCYSYKTIDNDLNKVKLSKFYKVELNNSEKLKGRIVKVYSDSISINAKKGNIRISKNNISSISRRKFSYFKTIGINLLITTILIFIAIDNLNFGKNIAPNKIGLKF